MTSFLSTLVTEILYPDILALEMQDSLKEGPSMEAVA